MAGQKSCEPLKAYLNLWVELTDHMQVFADLTAQTPVVPLKGSCNALVGNRCIFITDTS